MANKYRIGVIGHTGRGNYGHGLDTVWQQLPNCEIVGVADANEDGLAAAAKKLKAPKAFSDYRKLLDETKPHIVAVCPRHLDQHHHMVIAAAERGIHVYQEKPMCRSLEEADQMATACEKNNVKLAIAHQTRYSPKLHVIQDMIYDGKIGKVLELRGRGKEDRRGGGEDLWVLGSHIMNLMHHFGGEPNWCYATVQNEGKPVTKKDVIDGPEGIGPLAGDTLAAMYGMDDSVTAYFASHRNQGLKGRRFGLQIYGSEGIVEILTGHLPSAHYLADAKWSPGQSGAKWVPISSAGPGKPEPLGDGGLNGGNVLACKDLIDAIEDDRLPECSVYEARTTVEMIAGVFESHRAGGPVEIPLKNRKNPLTML
jgi:predicted dehydrogenase